MKSEPAGISILRWADGVVLARDWEWDDEFFAFSLYLPVRGGGYWESCSFRGPSGDDGWPRLPFRNLSTYAGIEKGVEHPELAHAVTIRRLHDAVHALGIVDRPHCRGIPGYSAPIRRKRLEDCGGVEAVEGPGHMFLYREAEPDAPPWEWASPELAFDGEVCGLLGLLPPAFLRWPELVELTGATC